MRTLLALLPSPLLGPATWLPVADALTRFGWETVTPPAPDQAPRTGDDVMRSFLAALPAERDLVLVPHSNAGLYVPALTTRRRVAGYVGGAGLAGNHPVRPAPAHRRGSRAGRHGDRRPAHRDRYTPSPHADPVAQNARRVGGFPSHEREHPGRDE